MGFPGRALSLVVLLTLPVGVLAADDDWRIRNGG